MGLEEFVTEEPENEWHENNKLNLERLFNEELCPSCGGKGEQTERWYWRCTTDFDKCNVITYIPFRGDLEDASM